MTGILFDIQGFSVHDGPGCRTLIFFKGCPLSCRWCSNPEGKNPFIEPLYRKRKCTFDMLCVKACPHHALTPESDSLIFDRTICKSCKTHDCVKACCSGALQQGGYPITEKDLYRLIQRDRQYWGENGGITLTGGEPFAQPHFAAAILKRCHDAYIHTSAETCGDLPAAWLEPSLPYLDWIFYDIKHLDQTLHREWTGRPNTRIQENARWLAIQFGGRLIFRMTVVPGFNDHPDHIRDLARFIASSGRNEINLLPLHHLGRDKYQLVGHDYYTQTVETPSRESMINLSEILTANGITCYLGSDTPF